MTTSLTFDTIYKTDSYSSHVPKVRCTSISTTTLKPREVERCVNIAAMGSWAAAKRWKTGLHANEGETESIICIQIRTMWNNIIG